MNCTHCGTALPSGALFCGECGQSVGSAPKAGSETPSAAAPHQTEPRKSVPARWVEDPVTGTPLIDEPDDVDADEGDEIDAGVGPEEVRCEQCDSVMGRDDIFCGECGFVSRAVTRAFTSDFTGETRQLDLSRPISDPPPAAQEASATTPAFPTPPPEPAPAPTPAPEPVSRSPFRHVTREPGPTVEREELVLPEPPVRRAAPPVPPAPATPPSSEPPRRRRSFLDEDSDPEDLEATRIVSRVSGNRFVLQFSTGESFTVHGTGLIGRNPTPEPGEFFDHLVRVLDSGKSVSKTHLEFGQESGAFWLKDRFSGNGTIIREPDISARRAEPDRRYRVARGTRVDIGEQFFVIS